MQTPTRRDVLRLTAAGAAAMTLPNLLIAADEPVKLHTLPALPYAFDALEPHIDAQTMEIHHDRHHQIAGKISRRRNDTSGNRIICSIQESKSKPCGIGII